MKTKTLFLLCLFLGIGFTQLSAQSEVVELTWDYWNPCFCDGEQVDYVIGTAEGHCVFHYDNDGNLVWGNYKVRGEGTNEDGETFKIKEKDKFDFVSGIMTFHYNLKGDEGTHYIGSASWDVYNDPNGENIVVHNSSCPDN